MLGVPVACSLVQGKHAKDLAWRLWPGWFRAHKAFKPLHTGDSDETHQATFVANQGSASAAGVMPGATLVGVVIQMLMRGSVFRVESGREPDDVRCKAVAARSCLGSSRQTSDDERNEENSPTRECVDSFGVHEVCEE